MFLSGKLHYNITCYAFYVSKSTIVFGRMTRKTDCVRLWKKRKLTRVRSPKIDHDTGENYDQVEENSGYQEIGDMSKPTFYENMA